MKIVPLEPPLEPLFWKTISQDIPHYYFFAFDWKYRRDQTKILLALDDGKIHGMMLIYRDEIVNLRGSPEAAKILLEKLDLEKIEIQSLEEHKPHILEKYEPTVIHGMMMVMLLRRGKEKLHIKHPVVKLGVSDAEQIAAIMKAADPEFWGDVTSQDVVEGINHGAKWFGVKANGQLVSIGNAWTPEWVSLIGTVATNKKYRNMGYATSVVSTLIKEFLAVQPSMIIFVRSENAPAIHVYEKVGFKQYRKYFFMRGTKRKF
ncbi:MAG: GNAT family N-acetyltransferase [Candidatus Bathyarchaeia archaeon]